MLSTGVLLQARKLSSLRTPKLEGAFADYIYIYYVRHLQFTKIQEYVPLAILDYIRKM